MMQPCSSSPAPVVFIGLDCVPLGLLERLRPKMPHMDSLLRQAAYGPLRSSTPPITVPAWASMLSGRDAGELGMYGFRSKVPGAYAMRLHDARDMQHKRVWDWAAETGKRVAVVSVPLTWPPPAVRGQLVSSLLWPGKDAAWTHPPDLAQALEAVHGPYRADIDDFRREDSEAIWPALHSALRQHFAIARDLWQNARPDLLLLVILATDRLHHRFWHRLDPAHPRYIPDHPDNARAEAFYQALDAELGVLLALLPQETHLLLASDHGAQPLHGVWHLNEWLRQQGLLQLVSAPDTDTPLHAAKVDWSRTRVWAEGGYYARIFLNLRGREAQGTVRAAEAEALLQQLKTALGQIRTDDGVLLPTQIAHPQDLYRRVCGYPPDLLLFIDDLSWRISGRLRPAPPGGRAPLCSAGDGRGTDSCNHAWEGFWALKSTRSACAGPVLGAQLEEVAATLLTLSEVTLPPVLTQRNLLHRVGDAMPGASVNRDALVRAASGTAL